MRYDVLSSLRLIVMLSIRETPTEEILLYYISKVDFVIAFMSFIYICICINLACDLNCFICISFELSILLS